jgi:hypothetical protein
MVSLSPVLIAAPPVLGHMELALVVAHLVATVAMASIVWFVQVVHYPLFAKVGPDHFVEYERVNTQRTSLVVGPPMAVEGVTALLLFFAPPDGVGRLLPFVAGVLLAVVLLSTIAVQVPLHGSLSERFDTAVVARLVRSNWLRTIGWSARTVLAVVIVWRSVRG